MVNVRGWCHALFDEPTPLRAFGALELPVLCMLGGESPASARGVTQLLASVLPNVSVIEFAGLGHMAPVTHPAPVNEAIAQFLARY
jgi:pimeloyl-ACP methyl ester carboxylesterase